MIIVDISIHCSQIFNFKYFFLYFKFEYITLNVFITKKYYLYNNISASKLYIILK
jgi:hypothetical protein